MSELNSALSISEKDFTFVEAAPKGEARHGPSRSYWQSVWQRLNTNRRAIWSLWFIVFMVTISVAGPWIWTLDPVAQDLTRVSSDPGWNNRTLLVANETWLGKILPHDAAPASDLARARPSDLQLAQPAHTESVRLIWQPVAGAVAYRVYRHILDPSGPDDLGLPLATTERVGQVSFEDKLKLETRRYVYSVVAVAADGTRSMPASLAVTPEHAIGLNAAIRAGWVSAEQGSEVVGTYIDLPRRLLGTDYLGRDMLARLVYGGRTSLFVGMVAPFLYVLLGVIYGGLAGYLGGRIDELMMRFADFVIALPFLLFMILFRVAMGVGPGDNGILPLVLAMVLLGWPSVARLVRGQVLQLREQPFVEASRMMGAGPAWLISRHLLPNVLGVVLVSLTFAVPSAIFTEAFLSFIGMGVSPPTPSWGTMCNDGTRSFLSHPHELILPALVISATVLAFNLLGDGLRDALDSRLREV